MEFFEGGIIPSPGWRYILGDFFLKKLKRLEEDIRHCKRMVATVRESEDFDRIAACLQKMNNELETLVQIRRQLIHAGRTSSATLVTDADGNIEYVNPGFMELTGYSSKEVVGKNPRILKSGNTSAEDYRRLWDTLLSGGKWRGQFCNKKKSSELYWESACILPIKNLDGVITHFVKVAKEAAEESRGSV